MSNISFDVFTVELKLDAINTPYRTVSIPSFYTFDKLHEMIVWLFQWSDEHSHTFKIPINKKNEDISKSKEQEYDSSSSLIQNNKNNDHDNNKTIELDIQMNNKKQASYYWVSNMKSFPIHPNKNIKRKLESRVMLQNALHYKNDCIVYQYDFDSNINSNWSVVVTLLAKKSIRNFPIADFDPFEFVDIIDGDGKTIPEYDIIDIDYQSDEKKEKYYDEKEFQLREYNPKRLNEELQIMRSKYTMFYEDYKKNKKKKRKMRQQKQHNKKKKKKKKRKKKKENSKYIDAIHSASASANESEYIDATTDATISSSCPSSSTETDSSSSSYNDCDELFESTTESDIYHNNKSDPQYQDINDYDHILMYTNKKKGKKNRKRKQYLCVAFLILFCIFAWILYSQ